MIEGLKFKCLIITSAKLLSIKKFCLSKKLFFRDITLIVAKRATDQRSETLSALCDTMAVDVSMWVETTK
jgi:hypothetical protein